jgi:hypothetical protein
MNQQPRMLKRTQERHFSAHHLLIETARVANERASRRERGWSYDALTATLFSALAIEALANAFGERKVENWTDFESAGPNAKLQVVSSKLGVNYNKTEEPWATARWLIKFRSLVAHAKPQLIRDQVELMQEDLDKRLFDRPESKIEREITPENAERSLKAANSIKDLLCGSIPPIEALGLITVGWSGFTSRADDA